MPARLPKSRGVLFGLLVVLVLKPLSADVHPLRVVSQTCQQESCRRTSAYGSAVSIGRDASGREVFLTAAHCTRGTIVRIEIGIQGQWFPALLIARAESDVDLALLSVTFADSPIRAARIASAPAALGAEVTLTGFPQGGAFRKRMGKAIPHRFTDYDLVIDQPSLPGESGGGIFNDQGELVGLISATAPAESPRETLAVGLSQIRNLLERTFPVPPCRAKCPPASPAMIPAADFAKLERELNQLQARLAALEAQAAKLAALESQSPKPAAMDPAWIRRLERLEQLEIPVQILSPEGQVLDESRYPLGQPLQFRLIPKRE